MKKLWLGFGVVFVVSFSILGWIGTRIYQEMPPIPAQVVTTDGTVVVPAGDIGRGQNVWQSLGGMEVGSIWGHGSYVAPDWTADWLHREATFVLDEWANKEFGKPYEQLPAEDQAQLRGRLQELYRTNTYDAASHHSHRSRASPRLRSLPAPLFRRLHQRQHRLCHSGRQPYAAPSACASSPPSSSGPPGPPPPTARTTHLLHHNWPHEPLVGNQPTGESVMWTGVSIIMLLAGICAMVWWYAVAEAEEHEPAAARSDPLRHAGRPRPRSAPRSSTSGWSPR